MCLVFIVVDSSHIIDIAQRIDKRLEIKSTVNFANVERMITAMAGRMLTPEEAAKKYPEFQGAQIFLGNKQQQEYWKKFARQRRERLEAKQKQTQE